MKMTLDMNLKSMIAAFNEQEREEFRWMRYEKYHLLKEKKWSHINGKLVIHSKYSPQQQKYALEKCLNIGVRATSISLFHELELISFLP